ncbi:MAG: hypothetical protein R3E09_00395 [Novosphingobium sp.]|nr:hypothetical protein [Novosphingobium sp.]
MADTPVRKICKGCRSETVTRDAWAEWDVERQEWVLGSLFDYAFCHNCASRTQIEDVAV